MCVPKDTCAQQLTGADLLAYAAAKTKPSSDTITLARYSTNQEFIAEVVIWIVGCTAK